LADEFNQSQSLGLAECLEALVKADGEKQAPMGILFEILWALPWHRPDIHSFGQAREYFQEPFGLFPPRPSFDPRHPIDLMGKPRIQFQGYPLPFFHLP
jgi:hypothetical protein